MSISIFDSSDERIWIPVAKSTAKYSARAFLPFDGLNGEYTFGYKSQPETGKYFQAIQTIQKAYISDERQLFWVKDGTKKENQKKHKWRHGKESGAPLLGPTLGWVEISLKNLEKSTSQELAEILEDSQRKYATYEQQVENIEPVICASMEELDDAVAKLLPTIAGKSPMGQRAPLKKESSSFVYNRDATVVAWVLSAANGICECCEVAAPFIKKNGLPFLEVHHVRQLAAGGSDTLSNTVAVCPNCHRELHYGQDKQTLIDRLYSQISRLIKCIATASTVANNAEFDVCYYCSTTRIILRVPILYSPCLFLSLVAARTA